MTRPVDRNGLGLSVDEARQEVETIEAGISFLSDGENVYREWRNIVVQYGISGVQVYVARLAAAMYVHQVSHLLTLNVSDFARFPRLTVLHPRSL